MPSLSFAPSWSVDNQFYQNQGAHGTMAYGWLIWWNSFPPKMLTFHQTRLEPNVSHSTPKVLNSAPLNVCPWILYHPSRGAVCCCAVLSPGPCSECSDCILISQGSHKAGYCDCSQQLFVFVSDINCFMANFLHRIVNPGREQSTSQHITSKPLYLQLRLARVHLKEIPSPFSFSLFMLKVRCGSLLTVLHHRERGGVCWALLLIVTQHSLRSLDRWTKHKQKPAIPTGASSCLPLSINHLSETWWLAT